MDPNLIGTCAKKRAEFFAIGLDSRPSPNKAVIQVSLEETSRGVVRGFLEGCVVHF